MKFVTTFAIMFDFFLSFQPSVKQTLERSGIDVCDETVQINEAGLYNVVI